MKGNGKAMELSNPFWELSDPGFGSSSVVITSPKVHGDVVSIFTWYSLRQTLNRGRHIPSQSEFGPETPVQHFPKSSFPASLSNDISRNSKTPEELACQKFVVVESSIRRLESRQSNAYVFDLLLVSLNSSVGFSYFKNAIDGPVSK